MRRIWERLAGIIGALLVTLTVVSAFSFVSQPVHQSVSVTPPTGNLVIASGAFPTSYVINSTVVTSFVIKDASTTDINFSLNLTITGNVNLTSQTVLIGGENTRTTCFVGTVCYFLWDRSVLLYAQTSMQVDISISFHAIFSSLDLRLVAFGNGG